MSVHGIKNEKMKWSGTGLETGGIVPGAPAFVRVDDISLVIVSAEGRHWAIEDLCSHASCAFSDDGEIDGLTAVCDCHGSEFDVRTGAVLAAPATDPIRTFPTRIANREVEVYL